MTLEEAIRHAEEKAKCGGKCGEDHAQLAGWLKELQERRAAELEKRTEERTETHACDTISRQAAIDAIDKEYRCTDHSDDWDGLKTAMLIIENLPSAQPERKTGRWIEEHIDITDKERPKSFRFHRCSACGYVAAPALFVDEEKWLSYCPHCGADMRGEQDE